MFPVQPRLFLHSTNDQTSSPPTESSVVQSQFSSILLCIVFSVAVARPNLSNGRVSLQLPHKAVGTRACLEYEARLLMHNNVATQYWVDWRRGRIWHLSSIFQLQFPRVDSSLHGYSPQTAAEDHNIPSNRDALAECLRFNGIMAVWHI